MSSSNGKYIPERYFVGENLVMGKAIAKEDTEEIIRLVKEEGYNPSTRETSPQIKRKGMLYENTYLNYAVSAGKYQSAKALLELGADVNALIFLGSRGIGFGNMNMAVRKPDKKMINLLLEYHIDLNNPMTESPLNDMLMKEVYDMSLYELLIKNGANVNHQNYVSGTISLSTARTIGRDDMVKYFLKQGADPLQVDIYGYSFASVIQREIEERSQLKNPIYLKKFLAYKQLLINNYDVQFPVEVSYRRVLTERVKRYDNLSQKNKDLLGEKEKEHIDEIRHALKTGIYHGVKLD